jgi:hypothetical protein
VSRLPSQHGLRGKRYPRSFAQPHARASAVLLDVKDEAERRQIGDTKRRRHHYPELGVVSSPKQVGSDVREHVGHGVYARAHNDGSGAAA